MWRHIYVWKLLIVSCRLVMLVSHWPGACSDIVYLTCQLTSQDHVVERSCNFLSVNSLLQAPYSNLPGLVAIDIVLVEI